MTLTTTSPDRRFTGDFRADVLVAIVVAAALLVAYGYQRSLRAQTTRLADPHSGFSLSIPHNWTVAADLPADTFVSASDARATSIYKSSLIGQSFAIDPENPAKLDDLVNSLVTKHNDELLAYHLFEIQPTTIAGAEARTIQYAYITQPIAESFMASPPVVVIATDTLIYTNTEYWVVTTTADEKIADQEQPDFDRILQSITLP